MPITTHVCVKQWGNSHGIRIPKEFLNTLDIHPNEEVLLEIMDNALIIRKDNSRKTLEEYAAAFGGRLGPYEEFDWGEDIEIRRWLDDES